MSKILRSINPSTAEIVAEFPVATEASIDSTLEAAAAAFTDWRRRSVAERCAYLERVANLLDLGRDALASLLTEEMGKTLAQAEAEVEKCALVCRYYASRAEEFLSDRKVDVDGSDVRVIHRPLGPVLAVMPWNFPFWQVFRFAAPALAAGNVAVLKHAANVPRCAVALSEIFGRAGFPRGVFQSLLVTAAEVERILADDRVKAATVTGSTKAGASVASIAGARIKKTVLELGGSDAFIVMPTADFDAAIETGVTSRTLNNGQSCIAAKRFIVHRDVYPRFVDALETRFAGLAVGDPFNADTDVGPLAKARSREKLERQIEALVDAGAQLSGGRAVPGPGYFLEPGVLVDVPRDSAVYREEIFGPIALLFDVSSLDEAIAIANDSDFGLGSSIWTADGDEAERAALELEAGATFINSLVRSDPRWPFGGIERSGYGRELSAEGIREFVNAKTIVTA